MKALDIKLLRDFVRLWPQALAVSLVLACGVATLVLAIGAYRSLDETRLAYYERNRFASVFAFATRAPNSVARKIQLTSGVLIAESRLEEQVLLDIPGMAEPAAGLAVSIPDHGQPRLNQLYLREGRLPELGRRDEVVVSALFAEAHGFHVGSSFSGTLAGHKITFRIAGLALSPEFIYALGPGDLVPDARRYAIIWMRQEQLAALTDLDGAFNSISVSLLPGASADAVVDEVDRLLKPYGGTGAFLRKDQPSHAFLDSELQQLSAMAKIIPPIFLFVSAFLVNMILARLVSLEREQIGLLKALGYGRWAVATHYMKLVLVICIVGIAIGFAAGTWLGAGLTRLYATFFNFPFLIFQNDLQIYLIAACVSIAAALAGALKSVFRAAALPAAAAMRPAAPPIYSKTTWIGQLFSRAFSQLTVMGIRHLVRWPLRSAMTSLGSSLAVALLVTAMFSYGSLNSMIDTLFFQTDRQDATISFTGSLAPSAMFAVKQMPGVLAAEPFRTMMVELANGSRKRRVPLFGKPEDMQLSRVLDLDGNPVELPKSGIILSERTAMHLDARVGNILEVKLLEEGWRQARLPVVHIIQSYLGLGAYMDLDAMDRLSVNGPRRTGAYIELDMNQREAIYSAIKETPAAASIGLKSASLEKFRDTIEQNISIMTTVYVVLAVIIAFGVVYNSTRIQLSERARELASLRVLGFTRSEVSSVLVIEIAVTALVAQPLGWLLGYIFSWAVVQGFQSDLFRIPFVVETAAFGWSSSVVLLATSASAFIVLLRVRRLDMIRVLKSKE